MRGENFIIYDGECIFCQNYVRYMRLREAIGRVDLVDARSGDPRVERFWRKGFDLDEGMIFVRGDTVHYGADATYALARLSSGKGLFNKLNGAVFKSALVAKLIYPALKLGRRVTLLARGRKSLKTVRADAPTRGTPAE